MHWLALAEAMLAIAYYQVGSMSVWILVLSVVLKVVAIIVAVTALVAGLLFLWPVLSGFRIRDFSRSPCAIRCGNVAICQRRSTCQFLRRVSVGPQAYPHLAPNAVLFTKPHYAHARSRVRLRYAKELKGHAVEKTPDVVRFQGRSGPPGFHFSAIDKALCAGTRKQYYQQGLTVCHTTSLKGHGYDSVRNPQLL